MRQFLRKIIRNERGVALIEFSIVFPFMFLLLFGAIELCRYIIIIQRVEHAAYTLTDIVGQYTTPTATGAAGEINVNELTNNVFPQFHRIMGRYGDTSLEVVVMSSVVKVNNGANGVKLNWQRSINGGGVPGFTSIVTGSAPQNTTRTNNTCPNAPFDAFTNSQMTTMLTGENMIVGEVSYRYKPIVASLLGVTGLNPNFTAPFQVPEQTITRRLFLHPRNGDLPTLPPAVPFTAGSC